MKVKWRFPRPTTLCSQQRTLGEVYARAGGARGGRRSEGGTDKILSCVKVVQLNLIFKPSGLDFHLFPLCLQYLRRSLMNLKVLANINQDITHSEIFSLSLLQRTMEGEKPLKKSACPVFVASLLWWFLRFSLGLL